MPDKVKNSISIVRIILNVSIGALFIALLSVLSLGYVYLFGRSENNSLKYLSDTIAPKQTYADDSHGQWGWASSLSIPGTGLGGAAVSCASGTGVGVSAGVGK